MPIPAVPPQGEAQLNDNARTVIRKRYLIKDATGTPAEQPEDMFWRVAGTVAEADRRYGASDGDVTGMAEQFYRLMVERRFEPNSPTLMNAGRPLGQLSACFVLPVEDALSNGRDGIYDTLRAMALIHQSGGGTGFGFSQAARQGLDGSLDDWRGFGSRVVHEAVRCLDRRGQAGRHAPRRQHGNSARRSSGHHGLHHLQGRPDADHELQHLRRRHRQVHGRGESRDDLRSHRSVDRQGRRPARRARRCGTR